MSKVKDLPTVCIVGRTNVGKSTLFNALVGRRTAVVKDTPGVTRDRCYEVVTRLDRPFTLIDTGALVGEENIALHHAVREQSELAMRESDLIIVVFDGLHGLHPLDSEVVDLVRQSERPVIYVANKCEKPSSALTATELYGLGLDEVIPLSAAHRRGVKDLLRKIEETLWSVEDRRELKIPAERSGEDSDEFTQHEDDEAGADTDEISAGNFEEANPGDVENADEEENSPQGAIRFAVIGKPNVGKSTFVNKLLGEDRMITSPLAGTTRDSISSEISRNGRNFIVVDTAGLRKKAGVRDGTIERFSNIRTLRSLAQSDVAVFLLDAAEGIPTEQDARIVGLAHEKGKGIVIVVNKWDLIEKHAQTAEAYRAAVRSVFKFAAYAPVVFVSALTGQRCLTVLDSVAEVRDAALVRVSTAEVNKIFADAFASKPPPVYRGHPVKLLYATQVSSRPPTFAVFVNYPERLSFSYERYLKNTMRRIKSFTGNDIKILFRRRSKLTNDRRAA